MADGVPSWNIRSKNNEFIINTVIYNSEDINPEISDELRKRFSSMSRYIVKNPLWAEMNTMKCVIYKHHNQHGKEKYFQGLKMIQKYLARLREMKLEGLFSSFLEKIPKKDPNMPATFRYPTVQAIEYMLFKFMGAAKLITQTVGHCKSTLNYVGGQLSMRFFISFHVVVAASLSRFWILLKDFFHNIVECYEKLYPWLDNLQEACQEPRSSTSNLPQCLKTWIMTTELDNTLFETQKSKPVLEKKLLSFTPASVEKSFDASLNSPASLPGASEAVPRELFKNISSYNTTASFEKCGTKHEVKEVHELQACKPLHFNQDKSDVITTNTSETITRKNGSRVLKKSSYYIMHYPSTTLRYSSGCGTFKLPSMKWSRRIVHNSKVFEAQIKCRRKLQEIRVQGKVEPRRKGYSGYYKKRIIINAKYMKNKCKITLKGQDGKCLNKWKRKMELIVSQRKGKMQRSVQNNGTSRKIVHLVSNFHSVFNTVQHVSHNQDHKIMKQRSAVSRKYAGTSSLKRLAADQDSLTKTGKHAKHCNEDVRKRVDSERSSNVSMKEETNVEMLQTSEAYVDELFNALGV